MKTKIIFLAISIFTITMSAHAQKKHTQKDRVKQGIKTGEINKAEAAKIREERKDVRAEVKEAKVDGIVTNVERKEIKKERKDANKAIVRSKHNYNNKR